MSSQASKEHRVPDEQKKVRADKYISAMEPDITRAHIQRAFEEGLVSCNGNVIQKSFRVKGGDDLLYSMPEIKELEMLPEDIPLDILYEDKHFLAINKAPGMVVHPGAGQDSGTLVNALLHHCKGELSGIGGVERPGIVHRLDRETSGVIVVAKTDPAHQALSKAFAERSMSKEYLALVFGVPDRLSGSIEKAIGRHHVHRHKMCIREDGRHAHTDWKLLNVMGEDAAMLLCRIHTGRTHQIRVHLADLKHVILGDLVYGYKEARYQAESKPERVMLHAWRLRLNHPITGEPMELKAPVPADFERVMPGAGKAVERDTLGRVV